MNHHRYFSAATRPVECCIVGTGAFGRSFIAQARHVPLMNARIAVDVTGEGAAAAFAATGIDPSTVAICATPEEASAAWAAGRHVASGDLAVVMALPIDVIVEATGHPEAGARHSLMAVEAGKHLVLVSKEVDSVVGPGLARIAAENGCVVTPVDGDQPSLLMGLVTWAEVLGFEIVAAGKSSEYDFVFDHATGRLESNGKSVSAPAMAALWSLGDGDAVALVAARAAAAAELPQRTVPDLCEMELVANALGFDPDRPDFHAPIARITEIPSLFSSVEEGGLLNGSRRVDVFNCLRAVDEASFAGGVFIVVRCNDAAVWDMLAEKGHVVSRNRRTAMVQLPRHLLGLEAATSVLDAAINKASTGAAEPRPHLDLVARATQDLPAGTVLSVGGHHHTIEGLAGELQSAAPLGPGAPVPFYLAADRRLLRPVAKGALVTGADLAFDETSVLLAVRRRQDAMFFGPEA